MAYYRPIAYDTLRFKLYGERIGSLEPFISSTRRPASHVEACLKISACRPRSGCINASWPIDIYEENGQSSPCEPHPRDRLGLVNLINYK